MSTIIQNPSPVEDAHRASGDSNLPSPSHSSSPPNSETGPSTKVGETSRPGGLLYRLTRSQPTNYDMLLFRTLNKALRQPNHNDDYLAEKLRDALLPGRSWMIKYLPGAKQQMRRSLENPIWGVPGCINFIDARTKWFDEAVRHALDSGVRQIVQIAAGYDTRAYRLNRKIHVPGPAAGSEEWQATFFEVDLPSASERKQRLVKDLHLLGESTPPPVYIAADLSRVNLEEALLGHSKGNGHSHIANTNTAPSASYPASSVNSAPVAPLSTANDTRSESGSFPDLPPSSSGPSPLVQRDDRRKFDPTLPTLFTMEGLIYYLPAAAAHALLASISRLASPGSILSMDFMHADAVRGEGHYPGFKVTARSVANKGEMFKWGIEPNLDALKAIGEKHGLEVKCFLRPKDMVGQMLPHLKWNDKKPPIASFYSYVTFVKSS